MPRQALVQRILLIVNLHHKNNDYITSLLIVTALLE